MDANRKRLLYYLLLNIIVSACVTVGVMFIYDRYFHAPSVSSPPAQVARQADGTASLEIITVIGAGLPSSEVVVLRNTGAATADLKGWKLQDEEANIYTFADVSVISGGSLQLHTAPGTDTLIDLYWGLTASVWRSGETASLLDPAGTVKSVYKVP